MQNEPLPTFPVLPLRDVVVFPGVTVPLSIGRPKSLAALERAGEGGFMIVVTQRDPATEDPSAEELFPVACIVRVLRVIDSRAGGKQAIGSDRMAALSTSSSGGRRRSAPGARAGS